MTSKSSNRPIRLATSRQGLSRATSRARSIKLGGVAVWAESEEQLTDGIDDLCESIARCTKVHLSMTKAVLRKIVRDHRSESEIEDRLFSAVLGYVLRRGELDATVCASENDRAFRVLIHASRLDGFDQALIAAETLLRKERIIEVPRLERIIFGERSYNTWSSTAHVLGRLSYLGLGKMGGRGTCRLVEDVPC